MIYDKNTIIIYLKPLSVCLVYYKIMNKLDTQYLALLTDILTTGIQKADRTGTGTISIFGRQIRHKMSEGFPLLTTKKMYFKGIVTELIWFLRGDTNIKYLIDNGCHIWDGDCYKNYLSKINNGRIYPNSFTQEEFINKIKIDDEFAKTWGELGPIYGKQWRSWTNYVGDEIAPNGFEMGNYPIDQISNIIKRLKTNPDDRRMMVTAWNPAEIEHCVLPPCHYGFQVYTRELSESERFNLYSNKIDSHMHHDHIVQEMNQENVPTRSISLMWNQRSVDTFLGLPFNIASYGLLLEIIAKEVNMVPDELIGNLGDTHLYSNHIESVKEQIGREMTWAERVQWVMKNTDVEMENLYITEEVYKDSTPKRTRQPYTLPTLKINDYSDSLLETIEKVKPNEFVTLENYKCHEKIEAKLSN